MKSLKESLLADIEDTLSISNPYILEYPIPSIKDFYRLSNGQYKLEWQCPKIINKYINILITYFQNKKEFSWINSLFKTATGIRCIINRDKTIDTELIDANNSYVYLLFGVGDWVSNSLSESKKECIKFLEYIINNPDCIKTIFEYDIKNRNEVDKYNICDNKTYKKLLNY